MLDHALREQLLRLFEGLEASYVFDVTADPGHASRGELLELLEETAACSAKIGCRITDGQGLEFRLLRNDKDLSLIHISWPGSMNAPFSGASSASLRGRVPR